MMSMTFAVDQYFCIGQTHFMSGKPCQDYATAGVCDGMAYAIVSDGCSTGGETDVGSRVLALSTASALREYWMATRLISFETASREIEVRQQVILAGARTMLGLRLDDMLATCAYAYVSEAGGLVHIQGDGVIALCYRDGRTVFTQLDWEDNTPFYPAYFEAGLQSFVQAHGGDLDALRLSEETWMCDENGLFSRVSSARYPLGVGIRGVTKVISDETLSNIEHIVVFSDGITQIDGLEWKEATKMFTTFKGIGEFAKRRMISGIKNVRKVGKGPMDDISYAVIRRETELEEV